MGVSLAVTDEGVRFWFAERETRFDAEGNQTRRYLHLSGTGPTLARVEDGDRIELQYADGLQNLMLSLDGDADRVASFLYGPFGEVVHAIGAENHRRRFNGKESDAVTGLRYYGFRYYDPLTLRWNSADPLYRFAPDIGLEEPYRLNLYAFSLNNPVRYYDPDGREPKSRRVKSPSRLRLIFARVMEFIAGSPNPNMENPDPNIQSKKKPAITRRAPKHGPLPKPTFKPGQRGAATPRATAASGFGALVLSQAAEILQAGLGLDLEAREQGPFKMTREQRKELEEQRNQERFERFKRKVAEEMGIRVEELEEIIEERNEQTPPEAPPVMRPAPEDDDLIKIY